MTVDRIDPEVIRAMEATIHDFTQYRGGYERLTPDERAEAIELALRAADEKRRELAQADPGGQEYVYPRLDALERALLGTWERVDR